MTDSNQDPVRLFEDPASGPVLRGDLSAAAEAKVTGLDVAAGLAGLGAVVAAQAASAGGAAASTGAVAPVAATGLSLAAKAAIVGGLVLASVGAWVGLSSSSSPDAGVDKVPAPVVAATTPAPATPAPPAAASNPVVPPSPAASPADEAAVPEEAAVPDEAPVVKPTAAEPTKDKRRPKKASLSKEDAMAEAGLISRAKKALAARPSEALLLTDQAKRGFPKGMLVEEREAIAIQALAKLGKRDAAAARGERFLKRYGRGPHAKAVRQALDRTQ